MKTGHHYSSHQYINHAQHQMLDNITLFSYLCSELSMTTHPPLSIYWPMLGIFPQGSIKFSLIKSTIKIYRFAWILISTSSYILCHGQNSKNIRVCN